MKREVIFQKESDLCAAFIASVLKKPGWQAYAETAGFDILLVRKDDGLQVGIEAKLCFNLKVLTQALPQVSSWSAAEYGPDHRAILVPNSETQLGLGTICDWLGITVISWRGHDRYSCNEFYPQLPGTYDSNQWHDWAPLKRCAVPDYVPDVGAGNSAPLKLTEWKISAIKLAIILEHRAVSRADFKALRLSPTRWLDPWTGWLVQVDGTKTFRAGPSLPDFRLQHPRNYAEIEADKDSWLRGAGISLEAHPAQTRMAV